MQTIGYYCDECRRKYVRHVCKNTSLPCGHSFEAAIRVYCKGYAKSGERVSLGKHTAFVTRRKKHHGLAYAPGGFHFWKQWAAVDTDPDANTGMPLGSWLKSLGAKYTRAFEQRWDSVKTPPDWVDLIAKDPIDIGAINAPDYRSEEQTASDT